MTDDDIKALAKGLHLPRVMWDTEGFREDLLRLVTRVQEDERERCATLLERGVNLAGLDSRPDWQAYSANLLTGCAAMIRAS